ncbi:unnamed protein product [Ilex paraguariensis]|uniref:Uncharacterized protein n=1 Tax=Ilex paraguariensis TaxID=185542 RepID=A0ABC8TR50_9AQUA
MMEVTEVGIDSAVKVDEEHCVVKKIVEESAETSPIQDYSEYSVNPQSSIEGGEENNCSEKFQDGMEVQRAEQPDGDVKECVGVERRDDNKWNRELLERLVEDNEKMVSLMAQLFEKNEMQTQMLNSLTHRVDQLEKAFMCDRMRRRKKRHTG